MTSRAETRAFASLSLALGITLAGCGSSPPPKPVEPPHEDTSARDKPAVPEMEYDLGPIAPDVLRDRLSTLKPKWNSCYGAAHEKSETLAGKVTFTLRTNKDGTVKWAYVTESTLGERDVEKCIIDLVKATDWGAPMEAKEGELKSYTVEWQIGDDEAHAYDGEASQVTPAITRAKSKLQKCRKDAGASGTLTATMTVAPKGKPLSVGVAIADPSADGAIDCVVGVLRGLTYTNRASQPIKVTIDLP